MPEQDHHTIGLGIKHGDRYYKTQVVLAVDESDNDKLAAAATDFIEKYFASKLTAEVTES